MPDCAVAQAGPQFLERAAGIGYPAVELMAKRPHLSLLDWSETELLALKRKAGELSIEIVTLVGYTGFTVRAAGGVPLYEMQLQYVRSVVDMARILGAHIVRVYISDFFMPGLLNYRALPEMIMCGAPW